MDEKDQVQSSIISQITGTSECEDLKKISTTTISKITEAEIANGTQQLSKKRLKKLKRFQLWEEKKLERRLKEREKYKKKKEEAIAKGLPTKTGPSRKELKRSRLLKGTNLLSVAIDLDFDNLMTEKDTSKCVKQLLRIYTVNRRSSNPANLHFTGVKKNGNIHKVLEKYDGYMNWDVHWHFQSYNDVFANNKVVYLTSDSNAVIQELEKDVIYIIGGLVDHNHQKGICYERAQKLDIATARLPLTEYVDMKTRTVLSTYHVFEILSRVSTTGDWATAILETIPKRKGAKPKDVDPIVD